MIFNGRAFVKERLRVLQGERKKFGPLSLGIVVGSADPVISSYVRIKEKTALALDISLTRYPVTEQDSTEAVIETVRAAATLHDGVIVQLPLGFAHDIERIVNAIPVSVDVDVISQSAGELFIQGKHVVLPPVASAINEIIDAYDIATDGVRAVVVGKGRLVGMPAYHMLKMRGADVVAFDKNDELEEKLREANIIVLGAGSPHLVTPDMVQEGVVVFDAGTSESGGAIVGDADPAVGDKASFFTPVPGGIGPVAVVEIFANLLALKTTPRS